MADHKPENVSLVTWNRELTPEEQEALKSFGSGLTYAEMASLLSEQAQLREENHRLQARVDSLSQLGEPRATASKD